ncbi:MAG: vitamin-B12 independent methionine synthase, partial [Chloroflexi bacterium]|nr:vitamin-B12 independent methionine synthase [Chloroflexota bacterium]
MAASTAPAAQARTLPLFPVTMVGSWPRSRPLLQALRSFQRGDLSAEQFREKEDAAVLDVLRLQEAVGVDIVTDGELRRDNFYSFVSEKLEGVQLMTLAEMLEVVEDRAGFEKLLQTLDVPAFSIRNPTCVGKVRRRVPLALDDYLFLKRHTDRAIKVTLPGPYLLTRAMWVKEVSRKIYATKEELSEDVITLLQDEIRELQEAGADFIQLD